MAGQHAQEITAVTRGWSRGGKLGGELKRLPEHLGESERLVNVDRAECTGRTGLLAVTDARLLFLRERMFKREVEIYPFQDVRTLRVEPQLFGGSKIVLDLDSGPVEFKKLDAPRAQRIVEYVQSRLRKEEIAVPPAAPRDLDQLKQSLGMLNRGMLLLAYRRLPDVLQAGESLGPGSYATREGSSGLVLATDRRLVFVPNSASKPPETWRYEQIRAIELENAKTINVLAGGRRDVLAAVDDGRGQPIVEHVRPRLGERVKSRDQEVREVLTGELGGVPASEAPPSEAPPSVGHPPAPNASPPPPSAPAAPLDLNTATADDLHQRLGLERATAERAIKLRHERDGFRSTDEFADALGLPPHLRKTVRSRALVEPVKVEPPRKLGDVDIG